MRNDHNLMIVKADYVGDSICVDGRTMARALPALSVRFCNAAALRQRPWPQRPCAQYRRCAPSARATTFASAPAHERQLS